MSSYHKKASVLARKIRVLRFCQHFLGNMIDFDSNIQFEALINFEASFKEKYFQILETSAA